MNQSEQAGEVKIPDIISEEEQRWREKTHEQQLAIRESLDEKYYKTTSELSKTIISLSAGTLAISMTLLKDVFLVPVHKGWLTASWLSFGASILLVVAGSHLESWALQRQIIISDDYYEKVQEASDDDQIEPDENRFRWPINIVNYATAAAFVVGYLFMGIFVWYNL